VQCVKAPDINGYRIGWQPDSSRVGATLIGEDTSDYPSLHGDWEELVAMGPQS
jgi:hypothetical protein